MKRLLFGVAVATALSSIPVLAAPKTQASIVLNVPPTFNSPNLSSSWPRLGDSVTFTVIFPDSLSKYPMGIQMVCYQGTTLVFVTAAAYDHAIVLGGTSSPWALNGGPATCHADLIYWSPNGQKLNFLASTDFDVAG
jgi:hypothetical protein